MDALSIFGLQMIATLITFAFVARWYVWPRLARLPLESALVALLWIHTLRTLGLTVLVPGVADPTLPREFALGVAYGDLLTAALAFAAIGALRVGLGFAIPLVWLVNLVGALDLANAAYQGIAVQATRYALGAAWLIPTYFVPALAVTHVMMFTMLLRRSRERASAPARP